MYSHMRLDYTGKEEHQYWVGYIYVFTRGVRFNIPLLFCVQKPNVSVYKSVY